MTNNTIGHTLSRRDKIALEILKVLLPEVKEKPLFTLPIKTYDSIVKDSIYTADIFILGLNEDVCSSKKKNSNK
jgi:hypothetical protein